MCSRAARWLCSASVVCEPTSGTGVAADAMMLGNKPQRSTQRNAGSCCSNPRSALRARVWSSPKRKLDWRAVGCVILPSRSTRLGRKSSKLGISSGVSVIALGGSGGSSTGSSCVTDTADRRRSARSASSTAVASESSAPSQRTSTPCSQASRAAVLSAMKATLQPTYSAGSRPPATQKAPSALSAALSWPESARPEPPSTSARRPCTTAGAARIASWSASCNVDAHGSQASR
mmetsp:Transcript_26345/g.79953  ORF Transcript_26345/g.79953 Transcript_26345/m.79953 type:complete len:233 (+) Transcript_26345:4136-4834(+)